MSSSIESGLAEVRLRIEAACRRAARSPQEVTLVAVTKTVPAEIVARAIALGIEDIGENRVQEMLAKQEALAGIDVRWHFIGTLQRNKAGGVAGRAVLVHSVDSLRLAQTLAARAAEAEVQQDVLLEVNVSQESTKHGVSSIDAPRLAGQIARLDSLRLRGLMTMAPAEDPNMARAAFAGLRELRERIRGEVAGADELSMGMSGDFEIAVEEGATIVRVGSAIFGERKTLDR